MSVFNGPVHWDRGFFILSNFLSRRVRFRVLLCCILISLPLLYSSLTRGSRMAVKISTRKLAVSTASTENSAIIMTMG